MINGSKKEDEMKKILQIDGGGIRGIIPAIVCAAIEKKTKERICDLFDLITGTSTGAIIGGTLAAGVEAEKIKEMYVSDGPELFKPRCLNWFRVKYDREPFVNMLKEIVGDKKMSELKTRYMAAAFNLCSGRTHFIKTWDDTDAELLLRDVIKWSALSAARYFGKVCAPEYQWNFYKIDGTPEKEARTGAVFQDGGQGVNNCTLGFNLIECMANSWDQKGVFILSLGCGSQSYSVKYNKAKKKGFVGQIIDYLFTQARREATKSQILEAKHIQKNRKNFTCIRLDTVLDKKQDKLDAVKYAEKFKEMGEDLVKTVPYEKIGEGKTTT